MQYLIFLCFWSSCNSMFVAMPCCVTAEDHLMPSTAVSLLPRALKWIRAQLLIRQPSGACSRQGLNGLVAFPNSSNCKRLLFFCLLRCKNTSYSLPAPPLSSFYIAATKENAKNNAISCWLEGSYKYYMCIIFTTGRTVDRHYRLRYVLSVVKYLEISKKK